MTSSTTIDWLRHGETRGGHCFRGRTNDPLTPQGWRQMWAAVATGHSGTSALPGDERSGDFHSDFQEVYGGATPDDERQRMSQQAVFHLHRAAIPEPHHDPRRQWDRIITSPLVRCADFARALSHRLALPLSLDPRLEELDFGAWEGQSAADLMTTDAQALSCFWTDPLAHPPTGGETLLALQARVLAAWNDLTAQALSTGERLLVISHGGVIRVILCAVLNHPLDRLLELEVGHASLIRILLDQTATGYRAQRLAKDQRA